MATNKPDGFVVIWNPVPIDRRTKRRVYARKTDAARLARKLVTDGVGLNVRVLEVAGKDLTNEVLPAVSYELGLDRVGWAKVNKTREDMVKNNRELADRVRKSPRLTAVVDVVDKVKAHIGRGQERRRLVKRRATKRSSAVSRS